MTPLQVHWNIEVCFSNSSSKYDASKKIGTVVCKKVHKIGLYGVK